MDIRCAGSGHSAAGDTFIGYFYFMHIGIDGYSRALEISSMASSLSVSKEGAEPSIPAMKEVLTANLKQKR